MVPAPCTRSCRRAPERYNVSLTTSSGERSGSDNMVRVLLSGPRGKINVTFNEGGAELTADNEVWHAVFVPDIGPLNNTQLKFSHEVRPGGVQNIDYLSLVKVAVSVQETRYSSSCSDARPCSSQAGSQPKLPNLFCESNQRYCPSVGGAGLPWSRTEKPSSAAPLPSLRFPSSEASNSDAQGTNSATGDISAGILSTDVGGGLSVFFLISIICVLAAGSCWICWKLSTSAANTKDISTVKRRRRKRRRRKRRRRKGGETSRDSCLQEDMQDKDMQDMEVLQDKYMQDMEGMQDMDMQDKDMQDMDMQDKDMQDMDMQDIEVLQDKDMQDMEGMQDMDMQDKVMQEKAMHYKDMQDKDTVPETEESPSLEHIFYCGEGRSDGRLQGFMTVKKMDIGKRKRGTETKERKP